QLRGDSARSAASESAPVPLLRPSISPAALVAEARSTMLATPVSVETGAETVTPIPRPVETKPRKSGSGVTRSSAKGEAPTTTPIIVVPPVLIAAVAPPPAPVVAPDRWQLLSSALARCNGNLF